jgi:hypothetical protein
MGSTVNGHPGLGRISMSDVLLGKVDDLYLRDAMQACREMLTPRGSSRLMAHVQLHQRPDNID